MVPVYKVAEGVAADDDRYFRVGILPLELLQRQKRIALSAAHNLLIARKQPLFSGDRQLRESKALARGHILVHGFMRRVGCHHEQYEIQRGFVPRNLGHLYMRAMDGVEGAAEQSDSHDSRVQCPSRFRQVSARCDHFRRTIGNPRFYY